MIGKKSSGSGAGIWRVPLNSPVEGNEGPLEGKGEGFVEGVRFEKGKLHRRSVGLKPPPSHAYFPR